MAPRIYEGPNGQRITLDVPDGDPGPSEAELDSAFGVTASSQGTQSSNEDKPNTFNVGAAITQGAQVAGNVARTALGGAANAVAGGIDAITAIPRAAGVELPSAQKALQEERAAYGNNFEQAKQATDLPTPEILKGIIGPTVNIPEFFGSVLPTATATIGGLGELAKRVGLTGLAKGVAVGAAEGQIQGFVAPTGVVADPKDELKQRSLAGAAGTVLGGGLGAAGSKLAPYLQKIKDAPIKAAEATLEATKGSVKQATEILHDAMERVKAHPHEETHANFNHAVETHAKAVKAEEKAQSHYEKFVKKYGLPPKEAAEPVIQRPLLDDPNKPFVPEQGAPNQPPPVSVNENPRPENTGSVPEGLQLATQSLAPPAPSGSVRTVRGPLNTAPHPMSTDTTAAYQHTPESLDIEVKRAFMQNALGEDTAVIKETLRDIDANPEYAAHAAENQARLVEEANKELQEEISKRYTAKLESMVEDTSGKNNGSAKEGTAGGNSDGPTARTENGPEATQAQTQGRVAPEGQSYNVTVDYVGAKSKANATTQSFASEEAAQAYASTYTDKPDLYTTDVALGETVKPRKGITQLNSGLQPLFDFLDRAANPVGRVELSGAEKAAFAKTQRTTTNNEFAVKSFPQQIKDAVSHTLREIQPALTNRFSPVQALGDDARHAVNRHFGMSAEASSYLTTLGAQVKDAIGVGKEESQFLNEYIALRRLAGRAASSADAMVEKRFGKGAGPTDVQARINALQNSVDPAKFAEMHAASDHAFNTVTKVQDLLQESGIISATDLAELRKYDPQYIPFSNEGHALEDLQAMRSPSGKKLGVNSSGSLFKRVSEFDNNAIHGGTDRPPLDNMLPYVEQAVKRVRENEVVKTTIAALGDGAIPVATGKQPTGFVPVSHMVDGEVVEHYVPREIAETLARLTPKQAEGFGKVIQNLTKVQTGFATAYNTVFSTVQIVKDLPQAILQNPDIAGGIIKNVPKAIGDNLTEAVTGKVSPAMREFYESGAGGSFINEVSTRPSGDKLRTFADEALPTNVIQDLKRGKLLSPVTRLNTAIDNIPRQAAYQARKAKLQSLGLGAKEVAQGAVQTGRNATVDFAEGGYLTKALNQAIPFANVSVQGPKIALTELMRNMKDHPAALAAVVGTGVIMPEVLAWQQNHSTKEIARVYDDLDPLEKEKNVIFVVGTDKDAETGRYTQIVKYPINDSFKEIRNAAVAAAQYEATKDLAYAGKAFEAAKKIIPGGQFIPTSADSEQEGAFGTGVKFDPAIVISALPFGVKQTVEVQANYSFFRKQPLLNKVDKDVATRGNAEQVSELQKASTTSVAKLFNKGTGLSPIESDYVLDNTLFGGGGEILKSLANYAADTVFPALKPEKARDTSFSAQYSRRFLGGRGGDLEKRGTRVANQPVAKESLRKHQENNLLKQITAIISDPKMSESDKALKYGDMVDNLEKTGSGDYDTFEKLFNKASVKVAFPMDNLIYDLKRMSTEDAGALVTKKALEIEDDAQLEQFLQILDENNVKYIPDAPPAEPKVSALPAPVSRKITPLGDGVYKIADAKGTRTVRKETDGSFAVIG